MALLGASSLTAAAPTPVAQRYATSRPTTLRRSHSRLENGHSMLRGGNHMCSALSGIIGTMTGRTGVEAVEEEKIETYVSLRARYALFKNADEQEEVQAEIEGTIPSWLGGTMIVNGGGNYSGMNHMFDGYAYLAKFKIENGEVIGSGSFVDTEAYRHFSETGQMKWSEAGTKASRDNFFEDLMVMADTLGMNAKLSPATTDNASVNVVALPNGKVLAMSETISAQYLVDADNLKTLYKVGYNDGLQGSLTTAHPKKLANGNLVNFTRDAPVGGFHVHIQDINTLQREEIAYIPDMVFGSTAWVHDMAVTDKHVVICETPSFINLPTFVTGAPCDYVFLDWKPEMGTKVHVVPLDGSKKVKTYDAPPFFTFHYANAFEDEEGNIQVDMAMYDDPQILKDLLMENIRAFPGKDVSRSGLRRLTIPKNGTTASISLLVEDEKDHGYFAEFPDYNRAYSGKDYQYVYGMAATRPTNLGNSLAKWNLKTGQVDDMWHQSGSLLGEPVFVAAPDATSEDDGVLLAPLMDDEGMSSLMVFDSKTMEVLARAKLPYAIPYRFHGTFIPSQPAP